MIVGTAGFLGEPKYKSGNIGARTFVREVKIQTSVMVTGVAAVYSESVFLLGSDPESSRWDSGFEFFNKKAVPVYTRAPTLNTPSLRLGLCLTPERSYE